MASNFKVIMSDDAFQLTLADAGVRLVIVDFTATWCGPCQRISPIFEQLAAKYPKAVFLKIDVDICQNTAATQCVSAMPTFFFYRNEVKIDSLMGADPKQLEDKIIKWYSQDDGDDDSETAVKGQIDLSNFIVKSNCECLNSSDKHSLEEFLTNKDAFLESDCDEQLMINYAFNQVVKIHSIKISGPTDMGPKTVKLFINQPKTLDFDSAENMESTQTLVLLKEELTEGKLIPLKFVKFQSVSNISVFIEDNQSEGEVTRLDSLTFIGTPSTTTNMSEFKRMAGKKEKSTDCDSALIPLHCVHG